MSETVILRAGSVAVVGRPNAGKSTLVNYLVGSKVAIVSPRPQTTRHRLRGIVRRDDLHLELHDTPGTHRPLHRMNRAMMDSVREALRSADVVLVVVDASEPGGQGTEFLMSLVADVEKPRVLALNKIDRVAKPKLLPQISEMAARRLFEAVVPVSATGGDGFDRLLLELSAHLPEVDRLPSLHGGEDDLRFRAAEEIREALLHRCGQELPYSTAVRIDFLDAPEDPGSRVEIAASILVDRPGQKKIVVGAGGQMVKAIGMAARESLAAHLGRPVRLDLQVAHEAGWRENARVLAELPRP